MDQGGSGREEEEEEQEQERKKTGGFQRKLLIAYLLPPLIHTIGGGSLATLSYPPLAISHRLSEGEWGRGAYLPGPLPYPLLPASSYCLHFCSCSCSAFPSAVPA